MPSSTIPSWPHYRIRYFAAASSYTGKTSEYLPAVVPVTDLFAQLENVYPGITAKVLRTCLVTVNLEYVDLDVEEGGEDEVVIRNGDEVCIIPPVSSG